MDSRFHNNLSHNPRQILTNSQQVYKIFKLRTLNRKKIKHQNNNYSNCHFNCHNKILHNNIAHKCNKVILMLALNNKDIRVYNNSNNILFNNLILSLSNKVINNCNNSNHIYKKNSNKKT